jgi:MFS family permease
VFALNLAALIPLSRMREAERKKPASPEPRPNPSTRLPIGLVGRLLLPNAIISIGAGLLIPYLNVFFKEKFAIPDATLGTVFSISSIMTGVATLSAPLLARRFGKVRAIVFSQLVSIPFLLALGFSPWLGVAVTAFWVRAALMNMGNPLYSAFAMEQVDEASRARVSSLLGMGWNIGWSVGPYVSGLMQMRVGFDPIFLITSAAYTIGAATVHLLFARTDTGPGI